MQIDIAEYYRKYGPMVLRRCRSILKDQDKALDAMQEVFVKLLQNQKRLKDIYPSGLLYRIATNVCLNIIRYERRRPQDVNTDLLLNIAFYDEAETKTVLGDMIDRIFDREKRSTREIAVMYYMDKMTLKEVADEVGLSVSGVRKRLRNLKTSLKDLHGLEEIL